MIRLAVNFDQSCIFKTDNRTDIGMKAMPPFWINEVSARFGAPDYMQIDGKIFACHAYLMGNVEIGQESLGTSCRAFGARFLRYWYPGLTAGPIHFRPFGPQNVYTQATAAAVSNGARFSRIEWYNLRSPTGG